LPYIKAISSCKTEWERRMSIEIKHGIDKDEFINILAGE